MDSNRMADLARTGGGWGMFEKPGQSVHEDMERQRGEMLAQAAIIAAPFLGRDGERCLDLLFAKTFLRPMVLPIEGSTVEQQAMYAQFREGQKAILTIILNAVAVVRGEDKPIKDQST